MRQINVYKYDELPTAAAKKAAREWWINSEIEDPAWRNQHNHSRAAALEELRSGRDINEIKRRSFDCELTGYCDDAILSDLIEELLTSRINDIDYIEENIISNGYEFYENGERV